VTDKPSVLTPETLVVDLVVHNQDIRWPLRLSAPVRREELEPVFAGELPLR
jgi:hypothetical protein